MGTKDFTDWNGRKRKEIVRPAPVRDKWLRGGGKKEKVGFKTMVDRYAQAYKNLYLYMGWRREYFMRRRKRIEAGNWPPTRNEYFSDWGWGVRDAIKKIRKLQAEYTKLGVLEKVVERGHHRRD